MVDFRCYDPSADGSGGIHLWYYREIASEIRSAIDTALEEMKLEAKLDGHPQFKPLKKGKKCLGIAEIKIDIRIKKDDEPPRKKKKGKRKERTEINVRILGPDCPPNAEFVLLTGFIKLGDPQYGPMCKQARNRQKGVERNAQKAKPCRFPKAKSPGREDAG